MREYYYKLRVRLLEAGLWPHGWVARGAWYSLGLAAILFLLKLVLGHSQGASLSGWVDFLLFDAAFLFALLAFGWLRRKLLWRLRNRLIVTYVFIGVIPAVLLVTMGIITLYGLAGQFTVFILTSEINSQLKSLQTANAAVSSELAAHLERGDNPASESLAGLRKRDPAWSRRQVCAWYKDKPLPLCQEFNGSSLTPPPQMKTPFREITRDHDELYLRVAASVPVGSTKLMVVTSEPFSKELLEGIAADLGEITLLEIDPRNLPASGEVKPGNQPSAARQAGPPSAVRANGDIAIHSDGKTATVQADQRAMRSRFTVGSLSGPIAVFDGEIPYVYTVLPVVDWDTAQLEGGHLVQVRTRPSILYGHLFAALGAYVQGVLYILVAFGIIFGIIELIALFTGTRMTRTVTLAVAQLYDATKHVDRGDFSHRIPVKSHDQLAELARSFNSMTASIERLVLEQKEKQRLENELAIAQEVQDQLFPRHVVGLESLEVHGFCRPARTVSGDYYDFLTANPEKMILAVGDISGKGISAALLMATIHSAVRAYSVESLPLMQEVVAMGSVASVGHVLTTVSESIELSPAQLLGLLNHQLYESTPPEKYATLFLGLYDAPSRRFTYSNGGHLPPILIAMDGSIRRLERGGTVVGLFDNMSYEEDSVEMRPGEIFIAYSDGVTEPENDFGEFGEERLIDLVRGSRHLPLSQISQAVTAAVDTWIGDNEQPDDVTLVLARAR